MDCYGFKEPGFGFIYFLVFDMKSKKKKRGWRWDEKRVSFGSGFFRRVMSRKMVGLELEDHVCLGLGKKDMF